MGGACVPYRGDQKLAGGRDRTVLEAVLGGRHGLLLRRRGDGSWTGGGSGAVQHRMLMWCRGRQRAPTRQPPRSVRRTCMAQCRISHSLGCRCGIVSRRCNGRRRGPGPLRCGQGVEERAALRCVHRCGRQGSQGGARCAGELSEPGRSAELVADSALIIARATGQRVI